MAKERQAWVVSVDMGYGHQRAAYPLRDIAYERIITANNDNIVTPEEQRVWRKFQRFYESVSQIRGLPVIGPAMWGLFDYIQSIQPLYPLRNLSRPTLYSTRLHRLIRRGFMQSLVTYTRKRDIPFISTFFAPAIAAAYHKRKEVYCVVTDSDINRIWVPQEPLKTVVHYLTPTDRAGKRLMEYGVPRERIFFTGFPLPEENIGKDASVLKHDLGRRLPNLDPARRYLTQNHGNLKKTLGKSLRRTSDHPLTVTYAIGGAGAQLEVGAQALQALRDHIRRGRIRVVISCGTRPEIAQLFEEEVKELGLAGCRGNGVQVLHALDKRSHFTLFNRTLRQTDILWTKPSELSFYAGLGIPIIIAPPLGSHEQINMKWLQRLGIGFPQEHPAYCDQWLFDWLESGMLAEAAFEGFMKAPTYGTENIKRLVFAKDKETVVFRY
ncbi:hypothetical protein JXB02_04515 [Candidatus Woesearchaeota archaeon]|nr:hypothetical protein [Candidatus Woesearchaeota archaeon]